MSKRLVEKLANLSKETSGDEHGVLKRLFNKVVFENNLEDKLAFLISKYERRRDTSKKKSKTVIVNEITSNRISFKNFLFLLFEVLRAKKVKICIEVEFSKKTTIHCVEVLPESLGGKDDDEESDKETKGESKGK